MGRLPEQDRIDEIPVLGNNCALLTQRKFVYDPVLRSVSLRKVFGVYNIVPFRAQPTRKPLRQLRVDKEIHEASACTLFTRLK